jgi:hypothetical protein
MTIRLASWTTLEQAMRRIMTFSTDPHVQTKSLSLLSYFQHVYRWNLEQCISSMFVASYNTVPEFRYLIYLSSKRMAGEV